MVRFANSGTEATMHALRVARAHTNREKFIMFEGCFHGEHDYVFFSTMTTPAGSLGSRRSPLAAPNSSGIPNALRDLVIVLPFNDFEMLDRTVKAKWGEIAAIMVEPIAGSMACVMPEPGWLEHMRKLCDEYGIVLIFDEVKTGFRVAKGGASELLGVRADLLTYAKAIANGFPLAAIGGIAEVMALEILETTDALAKINRVGSRLMAGIDEVLTEADIEHKVMGVPAMFCFVLNYSGTPKDFRDVRAADYDFYKRLSKAMRTRGVEFNPTPAPWMMCEAHSDEDVDATLNALNDAVKEARRS
ncbi:MAG: aminotransferase class III-fold pyridoxal phosphate-dependent enzyme, partial [Chloroflexi bacterium]|nr:aminotransferase class III-fold pyridoxal phosphate-dependent enzyme [Chloroflexota bacterium]